MQILQLAAIFLTLASSAIAASAPSQNFDDAHWSFYCHDGGFKISKKNEPVQCTRFWDKCTNSDAGPKHKALRQGDNFNFFSNRQMFALELFKDANCTELAKIEYTDSEYELGKDDVFSAWKIADVSKNNPWEGNAPPEPNCSA